MDTDPRTSASTSGRSTVRLSEESWVRHVAGWADPDTEILLQELTRELPWQQETIQLYGREVPQPRLTAVCGRSMSPASRYRLPNPPAVWTPTARRMLAAVCTEVPGWNPNGLIANLYRDGADSISWHADDEPALGRDPMVVSVSLGTTRTFRFRTRGGGPTVHSLEVADGDLVVMGGRTQSEFEHAIHKSRRATQPRLSLTFRQYL